jgi:hypothetical protein
MRYAQSLDNNDAFAVVRNGPLLGASASATSTSTATRALSIFVFFCFLFFFGFGGFLRKRAAPWVRTTRERVYARHIAATAARQLLAP